MPVDLCLCLSTWFSIIYSSKQVLVVSAYVSFRRRTLRKILQKFPFCLLDDQCKQSRGRENERSRTTSRRNVTATLAAPPNAARLRSTSVTSMNSTDPSGGFSVFTGINLKSGCKVKAWVLWLELIAVHILNFSADSLKMRTCYKLMSSKFSPNCSRGNWNQYMHSFSPSPVLFSLHFSPFFYNTSFLLVSNTFLFLFLPLAFFFFFSPSSLPTSLQSSPVAEKPRCVLCSAGSGLQPRWPAVVQLHTAGPTNPGEPPHQNPPRQGHLLRQTTSGGKHGRKHGGRGWGWNSWRGVAVAWTSVRRVCKDRRGGGHVGYIVECPLHLSYLVVLVSLFTDLLFPPGEEHLQQKKQRLIKSSGQQAAQTFTSASEKKLEEDRHRDELR